MNAERVTASTPCLSADLWLARCRLPVQIGEFSAVLCWQRRPYALLMDSETSFELPPDIVQAPWSRLRPGDLVCVRILTWSGAPPLIASVDSLDGRFAAVSQLIRSCSDLFGHPLAQRLSSTVIRTNGGVIDQESSSDTCSRHGKARDNSGAR